MLTDERVGHLVDVAWRQSRAFFPCSFWIRKPGGSGLPHSHSVNDAVLLALLGVPRRRRDEARGPRLLEERRDDALGDCEAAPVHSCRPT